MMANKQRDIQAEILAAEKANAPIPVIQGLVKERGEKIGADAGLQERFGQSQVELEQKYFPEPVQPAVEAPPQPDVSQMRSDLLRMEEAQKLAEVAKGTGEAERAVTRRAEQIEPTIKQAKTTASVSAQLGAKRLKDIFAATGAEAGTGAARQIGIEQGLQSQLGALDVEKARQEAQVQQDLSDIRTERAFLEQQIRSGTATADMAGRIADLEAKQAQAVKDAEIRSEREFTLMRDEMAQMNRESLARLDNSLKQENMVLDAQIQEARDDLQFERAQELERQRSQNNIKLQAIRQTDALALEDRRDELTEDERRLLDLEIESAEAEVKEAELRNKKLERDLEEIASDPVIETIPSDILNTLNSTFIRPILNEDDKKVGEEIDNDRMWEAVTGLYLNGNLTAQQADRLEYMYGLTDPSVYADRSQGSTGVYGGGR